MNNTSFDSSSGANGLCTYASKLPLDFFMISPTFTRSAGSGGLSTVSARPGWQSGVTGLPAGNARALPDISMFASSGLTWGHSLIFCYSGTGQGCDFSNANTVYVNTDGGTSFVAPAFSGIIALINQKTGGRQGQANNILYPLAAQQFVNNSSTTQPNLTTCAAYLGTGVLPACYFHDVSATPNPDPATQQQTPFLMGTTAVPCTGSATAAGVFTDTSTDPASNSENCFGYQITVTGSGSSLTTTPNYYGVLSTADDRHLACIHSHSGLRSRHRIGHAQCVRTGERAAMVGAVHHQHHLVPGCGGQGVLANARGKRQNCTLHLECRLRQLARGAFAGLRRRSHLRNSDGGRHLNLHGSGCGRREHSGHRNGLSFFDGGAGAGAGSQYNRAHRLVGNAGGRNERYVHRDRFGRGGSADRHRNLL